MEYDEFDEEFVVNELEIIHSYLKVPTPVWKEENMYNEVQTQRYYLQDRLRNVESKQIHKLRQRFHLDDDASPSTPKELVERIKAGKYVIPEKYNTWENPFYSISWRDPKAVMDQSGFDAVYPKLLSDYQTARDIISILPVEEGLKALNEFEAKAFH